MNTYTTKSGKTYIKKQICEAIKFWESKLAESASSHATATATAKQHINDAIKALVDCRDTDGEDGFAFDFDEAMHHLEALDDIL